MDKKGGKSRKGRNSWTKKRDIKERKEFMDKKGRKSSKGRNSWAKKKGYQGKEGIHVQERREIKERKEFRDKKDEIEGKKGIK
jgi:hypothetical protein